MASRGGVTQGGVKQLSSTPVHRAATEAAVRGTLDKESKNRPVHGQEGTASPRRGTTHLAHRQHMNVVQPPPDRPHRTDDDAEGQQRTEDIRHGRKIGTIAIKLLLNHWKKNGTVGLRVGELGDGYSPGSNTGPNAVGG